MFPIFGLLEDAANDLSNLEGAKVSPVQPF